MKPYYDKNGITLYLGDCREVFPALGIKADMILADPLYGETSLGWDKRIKGWPDLAAANLVDHGSLWCFGSQRMFLETATDWAKWHLVQDVVWEKHNGSGFAADRFKRVHELALQFRKKGSRWGDVYKKPQVTGDAVRNRIHRKARPPHMGSIGSAVFVSEEGGPRLQRSVIYAASCHGYAIHPTQKPVEIVRPLISYSCPPGGLVIDFFAGSGTTLEVCRSLGIRCVATEISEEYCEKIATRLSQELLPLEAA